MKHARHPEERPLGRVSKDGNGMNSILRGSPKTARTSSDNGEAVARG
jgi:hypothetical protein